MKPGSLKIALAALAALLLGVSQAQIGAAPATVLDALGPHDLQEEGGGYAGTDLHFGFTLRSGVVYQVTGEGVLSEAGIALAADLIGAATGYGEGISGPVAQFLASDRARQLVGQGRVPLGVEEFVLELELAEGTPTRVRFTLGPQEVPAALFPASSHALGPEDAAYVIREFSDFQCPFCARFATQVFPELKKELLARGDVRFEFHHFPLVSIHANAQLAGEAAECVTAANDPKAFWTFHDALFARQQAWEGLGDPSAYFVRLAQELGLKADGIAECLADRTYQDQIQTAYETAGGTLRLNSTPTIFVNGYRVANYADLESYRRAMGWVDAFGE